MSTDRTQTMLNAPELIQKPKRRPRPVMKESYTYF
jgi:hypothetical protein